MRDPESLLREAIGEAARKALGVEPDTIPLTYPPDPKLGDFASPVCLGLAKQARRPPRELAQALVQALEPDQTFLRFEVAGPGYINAFLDRAGIVRRLVEHGPEGDSPADGPKTIVEHTNINPNKAAHIGHLRNAVLGDTLVRFLRRLGRPVEVQNYIDDTGVQVADLVVGFQMIRGESLDTFRANYAHERIVERGERFDYLCWDLYAEVGRYYKEDETRLSLRQETLQAMEHGDNPTAELAAQVARRMVQHHMMTMDRIDVRYDLLPRESDILALKFWEHAFGLLKESKAIHLIEGGKHDGCWVMDLPGTKAGAGEDQKVIVRSNGTVTYVGKDIAYQMWKFGLLGRDFRYSGFDWSPQDSLYPVWASCSEGGSPDHPPFGAGTTVYNVIDVRQSYLQRVVTEGLRRLGYDDQADRSVHYAYEMVALSPSTVQTLFPELPLTEEDLAKPYLEMAGRRGIGVRADDLIDTLIDRAHGEVGKRNPDLGAEQIAATAEQIAIGALRYYMLRFSRNRVVAFDVDATLSFEGETGPYIQYSVVRAKNILAKLGAEADDPVALAQGADLDRLPEEMRNDHWDLVSQLLRSRAVIRQAVESLELSAVAKHAYTLAQSFNSFYHRYPVAQEEDRSIRTLRTALVRIYRDGMIDLLGTMGLTVPDRM